MADGEVPITVVAKLGDSTATAQVVVSVKEAGNESANFLRDVMPLFSKLGCNAIQCHGSAVGKGGFKLSMFGAEPDADYDALTKLHLGRRINRVEPVKSLFLLKATNADGPHGRCDHPAQFPGVHDARLVGRSGDSLGETTNCTSRSP